MYKKIHKLHDINILNGDKLKMYRKNKISNFPIVSYGLLYSLYIFLLMAILSAIGHFASLWHWAVPGVLILLIAFVMFFFRNPSRNNTFSKEQIVSPADGKVLNISKVVENEFINGNAIKVSIFLSIYNVHLNTSPIDGKVKYQSYREGKMLPAFKSHASEINERNTIGIESDDGFKVLVRQITGFVARRIVWWIKPEDMLKKGEKFGLIKFGSCTEILLPEDTKILVVQGQKVRAGETIIGERK